MLSGLATQGQTLSTSNGSWTGSPSSYSYHWEDCDGAGNNCSSVANVSGSTYALAASDVGHTVRSVVTASNLVGSTAAASPPSAVVSAPPATGVTFQPIDGGPSYFASKNPASSWMDNHILLGAWMEQPLNLTEVQADAALGDNIYWNYAGTPGRSQNPVADYDVVRAGGMHISAPSVDATTGAETVARDGNDESDMNFGPGSSAWNGSYASPMGNDCQPPYNYTNNSGCGYTVDGQYYSGVAGTYAVHQGYGKGVLFWEPRAAAAKFMNYSDILSADSYWITDSDLQQASQGGCALLPGSASACGGGIGSLSYAQSHLPANYEFNVARLEQLQAIDGPAKPVVVDVETGCPFSVGSSNAGHCATPPQTIAAAWHALIAGARGIVWFQHNFSGPCQDFRTLIDGSNPSSGMYNCQQTPGVTLHNVVQAITAFNQEVTGLTDVLLSPTANGYVSVAGDVSVLAKAYGGACYVFAGSGRPASPPPSNQSVTFTLVDNYTGPVTVYGENRTVQAANGVFVDTFADANSVHVYKIMGGSTC